MEALAAHPNHRATLLVRRRAPALDTLVSLVEQTPGIPVSEARRSLDVAWGTFYDIVSALLREGAVREERVGRRRLLYPRHDAPLPVRLVGHGLLRGRTARALARTLVEHPRATATDLGARLHLPHRVVHYHVGRLVAAGLVTASPGVRGRRLRATADLLRVLADMGSAAPAPAQP